MSRPREQEGALPMRLLDATPPGLPVGVAGNPLPGSSVFRYSGGTTSVYSLGAYRDQSQVVSYPQEIVNGGTGTGFAAYIGYDRPVLARYNTDCGTPAAGEIWGTIPIFAGISDPERKPYLLHRYLPGFRVLGVAGTGLVQVVRDPDTSGFVRIDHNWWRNHADTSSNAKRGRAVLGRPCDVTGAYVYDGSAPGKPSYVVAVSLPGGTDSGTPAAAPSGEEYLEPRLGSPFYRTGDVIAVRRVPGWSAPNMGTVTSSPGAINLNEVLIPVGQYLDDIMHTVKLWNGDPANLPRHWKVANGTDNSSANGGTGVDLRNRFVVGAGDTYALGATGGATTHTHAAGTGIASGANLSPTANHLPPYRALYWIERCY